MHRVLPSRFFCRPLPNGLDSSGQQTLWIAKSRQTLPISPASLAFTGRHFDLTDPLREAVQTLPEGGLFVIVLLSLGTVRAIAESRFMRECAYPFGPEVTEMGLG